MVTVTDARPTMGLDTAVAVTEALASNRDGIGEDQPFARRVTIFMRVLGSVGRNDINRSFH